MRIDVLWEKVKSCIEAAMCWPPGGKRWKVSRVRGQQYQSHFPIGQKNEHSAVFLIKMTFSLILPLASLHNIINHFCTILTNRFFSSLSAQFSFLIGALMHWWSSSSSWCHFELRCGGICRGCTCQPVQPHHQLISQFLFAFHRHHHRSTQDVKVAVYSLERSPIL